MPITPIGATPRGVTLGWPITSLTSCGWFFSDIAGVEARIVLRHAAALCHALARAGEGDAAEKQLVAALASAASHRSGYASGADVYRALA